MKKGNFFKCFTLVILAAVTVLALTGCRAVNRNAKLSSDETGEIYNLSSDETERLREMLVNSKWSETPPCEFPTTNEVVLDGVRYGFETLEDMEFGGSVHVHVSNSSDMMCSDGMIKQELLELMKSYITTNNKTE